MTAARRFRLLIAAFVALLSLPAVAALSDDDKACLACHEQEGFKKTLAKGETLSLHVRGDEFANSVHGPVGCAACHSGIDLKKHPGSGAKIGSAREYSIAQTQLCNQCHEDKAKLFEGSIHDTLLKQGNRYAPVCTDCHGAHDVKPKAVHDGLNGISCRKCHDAIFDAYAGSMHGLARGKPGPAKAPGCADCHRAHDVSPASTGTRLKDACLGCHEGAARAHEKWLPNTKLHLDVVACAACHAPTAQKRVDLRLYDPVAKKRMTEKEGQAQLGQSRPGAEAEGLDAKALWDLLRGVNRDGTPAKTTLIGRLEVRTGAEAHQLTRKDKAIRDCLTCHRQGADAFQNVTISIIGPDGRPVRYEAKKEVLSDPASVDAVGGFYAIGGTRIRLLDALLALALLAGLSAPIAHLLLRKLLKKKRGKTPPADRPGGAAPE